jgi:cytoskeletal protein RodZ
MRKIEIFSIAILFMAGVAVAGDVTQSEEHSKESTMHSTTMQGNADQTGEMRNKSTTVEKRRQTTTSDDMDGDTTTHENVEMEKKHSQTTTSDGSDGNTPGSTREYHQSETHHQDTTVENK